MPDYPPIPAGQGVPLVDLTTDLFVSTDIMAALDARYGQSGNAAGLFSARPTFGQEGRTYYATDQNMRYLDTGSAWLIAPGQLLASGSFNSSVSGSGTLVGRVKTAVNVPSGQKVLIQGGPVPVATAAAGIMGMSMRALDTGADVAIGTGTQVAFTRTITPAGSGVVNTPQMQVVYTASTGGAVSAGVFLGSAGLSSTDPWWLTIVSG